jgi:hypothetical protein
MGPKQAGELIPQVQWGWHASMHVYEADKTANRFIAMTTLFKP